jgi:hypothetical protein
MLCGLPSREFEKEKYGFLEKLRKNIKQIDRYRILSEYSNLPVPPSRDAVELSKNIAMQPFWLRLVRVRV